jgi:hypothetical protein
MPRSLCNAEANDALHVADAPANSGRFPSSMQEGRTSARHTIVITISS